MNNARRKSLTAALGLLDEAQALADQAFEIVSTIRDEEQEAFDNMPEGLQQAERGEVMSEAISNLESVELEDIFADARSYIENAAA